MVEATRVILAARRSVLKARTEVIQQIKSLIVTAPEPVRAEYRDLSTPHLVTRLAGSRARTANNEVASRTRTALKRLATRYQQLDVEIISHDADLALVQVKGISTITAAQLLVTFGDNPELLVTFGDNPERVHSEAAFAMLCGAAPIPASSGRTTRHRLNRGGDRSANAALHRIALVRLATDPDTRAYATKRTAQGKSKKDVLRCLKRAIAREVFHLIVNPTPTETSTDLRPTRQALGLTITAVSDALGCGIAKISRIERGHIRDTQFLRQYRTWLTNAQHTKTAT